MLRPIDEKFFFEAFLEAEKGIGHTRPNPPVGAVIVKDGEIVARGYHKKCGSDHAEVAAIKNAKRHRVDIKGASMYVTLEPCSQKGRVGACTEAIISSGIKEVYYGVRDPNPQMCGKAKAALKKGGVKAYEAPSKSDIALLCRTLIKAFEKRMNMGLPYVTVKLAMSLDGKICDDYGNAKWISSSDARQFTGKFREHVDVILVGAETVRKDDPSLVSHAKKNPDLVRAVITKSGSLPKNAKIFTDGENKTLLFKPKKGEKADAEFLRRVMMDLASRGYMWVLCEGGLKLATALAEAGLVDEWMTVLSPCVIGTRKISEKIEFGNISPIGVHLKIKELVSKCLRV
jgi:diaminohydroxyphosphoribosylaminopyrimidine deaminase/5-amino-6-(5-phosphoribosylamino)uracil reductase